MPAHDPTGYLHPKYAASLSEWGTPRPLDGAASWAIEREIQGTDRLDASGCYPLMACGNWRRLADDLQAAEHSWVTFTAVPDPLGAPDEADLRRIFPDHVRPFKTHYVVELERWTAASRAGHKATLRSAARRVEIEVVPARSDLLTEWIDLYAALADRHAIQRHAFSRRSFATLFEVPGMHIARAVAGNATVAMSLWAAHGRHAYYHLSAASGLGYQLSASYPMVDGAIRYFKALGLAFIDLGGTAGVSERSDNGLATFKRGWATAERTAWLCGRILDPATYRLFTTARTSEYFPAYREGEFS